MGTKRVDWKASSWAAKLVGKMADSTACSSVELRGGTMADWRVWSSVARKGALKAG